MVHPSMQACAWTAAAYAQLDRTDDARAMVNLFLNQARELPWAPQGDDADGWRQYWAVEFRSKDTAAREHLFDGLRKAGLSV
jgi:adenylate cyclase